MTPERSLRRSVEVEWAALAKVFLAGDPPSATGEDIVAVQAIVDALYASAVCDQEVDVDLPAVKRPRGRGDHSDSPSPGLVLAPQVFDDEHEQLES
jgi:hypothetical protein